MYQAFLSQPTGSHCSVAGQQASCAHQGPSEPTRATSAALSTASRLTSKNAPAALAADAGTACCAWGPGSIVLAWAGPAPATQSKRWERNPALANQAQASTATNMLPLLGRQEEHTEPWFAWCWNAPLRWSSAEGYCGPPATGARLSRYRTRERRASSGAAERDQHEHGRDLQSHGVHDTANQATTNPRLQTYNQCFTLVLQVKQTDACTNALTLSSSSCLLNLSSRAGVTCKQPLPSRTSLPAS